MRILARAAVVALAFAVASCSATRFAYNRLDWLAAWEIGKYVDLEGASKARFDDGFATLWQWHRSTQLSAYARDLREIADAAQGPVTREQIESFLKRANAHGERLFDEALPPSAAVLATLDDAQVRGLLKKMDEQREEENEEEAERTPEETREYFERVATRGLRRWLGSATDAQKQLAREWASGRRDDPELWRRYGAQWAAAFERVLATRAEPGFEARLRAAFRDPQLPDSAAARELNDQNFANYVGYLARVAPTLSKSQRKHLRDKLIGLAEDLEELAAQSQQAKNG